MKAQLPDISDQEFLILDVLRGAVRQGLYGSEIKRRVFDEHGRNIPLGSLYVTLGRLHEKGFLAREEGSAVSKDLRRQYYKITGSGSAAVTRKRAFLAGFMAARTSR